MYLSTVTTSGGYAEVGRKLGIGADNVALKVYRLRQRYGELIREEIPQTVATASEVDHEIKYLLAIIRSN